MGLYDIINNLQKKSDSTKKKILAVLILLSFVALATLWTINFKNQLSTDFAANPLILEKDEESPQKKQLLGPLASIKNGLSLALADIKDKTSNFLSRTEELVGFPSGPKRPVYKLPIIQ